MVTFKTNCLNRIALQPLASLFTILITCIHYGKLGYNALAGNNADYRLTNDTNTELVSSFGGGAGNKNVYLILLVFVASAFIAFFDIILLALSINKRDFSKAQVTNPISVINNIDPNIVTNKYYKAAKWIIFISSTVQFFLLFGDFLLTTPQSILQYGKMIEQSTSKRASSFNNYGNWCGFGGQGDPVDAIDECCFKHEQCYANVSYCETHKSVYTDRYDYYFNRTSKSIICQDKSHHICACDKQSAECMRDHMNVYNGDLKKSHYLDFLIDLLITNRFIIVVVIASSAIIIVAVKLLLMFDCVERFVRYTLRKICCNFKKKSQPIFLSKLTIFFNAVADLIELVQRLEFKALFCKMDPLRLLSNFVLIILAIALYLVDLVLFLTSSPPRSKREPSSSREVKPRKRSYQIELNEYRQEQQISVLSASSGEGAAAGKLDLKWTIGKWINEILKLLMLVISILLFVSFIMVEFVYKNKN